jgi:hypothetical protein
VSAGKPELVADELAAKTSGVIVIIDKDLKKELLSKRAIDLD